MSIECHKAECKYHSNNYEHEGPFCDEEECKERIIITQEQKDKELVEWLGKCWHKYPHPAYKGQVLRCLKCSQLFQINNPDLSTWEGFGWCWERIQIKKEFFIWYGEHIKDLTISGPIFRWESKTPRERTNLLWEFKKSRKEKI
jgi:hypothetical protein